MRRTTGIIGIVAIVLLAAALAIVWVGYEPMVIKRMGEDRAAEQTCAASIAASAGVIRQHPVQGDPDAADLDYAFNVLNRAQIPCTARYEVAFLRDGEPSFTEGRRLVQSGVTLEVAIPLGRYTRSDAASGGLPDARELKVWGVAPERTATN